MPPSATYWRPSHGSIHHVVSHFVHSETCTFPWLGSEPLCLQPPLQLYPPQSVAFHSLCLPGCLLCRVAIVWLESTCSSEHTSPLCQYIMWTCAWNYVMCPLACFFSLQPSGSSQGAPRGCDVPTWPAHRAPPLRRGVLAGRYPGRAGSRRVPGRPLCVGPHRSPRPAARVPACISRRPRARTRPNIPPWGGWVDGGALPSTPHAAVWIVPARRSRL